MTIKFTNNATSTLASGINDSATSISVASGQGGLFPTLSGADVFYATISNTAGAVEIVQVTARSTDTLTVVRGQDSTTALSWLAGDKFELRATAAGLTAMAQTANNLSDLVSASTARTNLGVTATGSDTTYAYRANNLSDLASASTARTNLGLATIAASGSASDLSTGTVGTARLASGTASSSTYLRGDQTWATVTSLPGTQGQVFTSSGTFTIPTGITAVKVTVVGGGGAGGYVSGGGNMACGGGGGGGAAIKYLTGLTPGNTLTVTRGAAGGTSSVASGTQAISTVSATGGATGGILNGSNIGGAGGTGSGGDLNIGGQDGGSTTAADPGFFGGTGGSSILGGGGRGGASVSGGQSGAAGRAYGGGGGGARVDGTSGGAGAAGVVIFEW